MLLSKASNKNDLFFLLLQKSTFVRGKRNNSKVRMFLEASAKHNKNGKVNPFSAKQQR